MADPETEWRDDRRLVLHELERLNRAVERVEQKQEAYALKTDARLITLHTDIRSLQVKSSTWGAVAGATVAFVTSLIAALVAGK